MKKTLIIVRHGNTFLPEQTPTRVGGKTDLPLVEEKRGKSIGRYLLDNQIIPDKIYAAPLKRTTETARLIVQQMNLQLSIIAENNFTEIDYGPDENKTEEEVELRLGLLALQEKNIPATNISKEEILKQGKSVIDCWNTQVIAPKGWVVDANKIIQSWKDFAYNISDGETVLLCTSNGIIRFAPLILASGYSSFCNDHNLKVATGSVSIFKFREKKWVCTAWDIKPYKLYENK